MSVDLQTSGLKGCFFYRDASGNVCIDWPGICSQPPLPPIQIHRLLLHLFKHLGGVRFCSLFGRTPLGVSGQKELHIMF
jgi:hypothetical protein